MTRGRPTEDVPICDSCHGFYANPNGILNHPLPGGMQRGGDGGGGEREPGGDQDEAARRRGKSKQAMFGESAHRDVARE